MSKIFKGFALAVSMLSIIPFFKVHDFYKGINGYAVMFYPFIGFLLGLILYSAYLGFSPIFPSLHVSVILLALWVLLTGALHLDGLSDTIDGLFVEKHRALEVMKDPHNGGMGMIFTIIFLLLKTSSLAVLDVFYLLPVILMLSRLGAVIEIYLYPYISKNGMGSLAKAELTQGQFFIALIYTFLISVLFGSYMLLFGMLIGILLLKSFFIKRYGGFTGDIYGFSIEITELLLLNLIIVGMV